MFTQLSPHVQAAIKAGRKILDGHYDVETASAFLFSAAVVGDFFWPSPQRRAAVAREFPRRDADMRHLVGLPDDEPADLDKIRNDLTHVDERLEELYLADPEGPMLAWGNGSSSTAATRRYMNFDPETKVLHSLGREINVAEVVVWLENLLARIGRVSMQLMIRSHRIGGEAPADG
jgi:hypothetical protein